MEFYHNYSYYYVIIDYNMLYYVLCYFSFTTYFPDFSPLLLFVYWMFIFLMYLILCSRIDIVFRYYMNPINAAGTVFYIQTVAALRKWSHLKIIWQELNIAPVIILWMDEKHSCSFFIVLFYNRCIKMVNVNYSFRSTLEYSS